MPHADLIMDLAALATAMQHVRCLSGITQRRTLAGRAEEIFGKVASEWTPNAVVVADAYLAFLGCIPLEAKSAKLDIK